MANVACIWDLEGEPDGNVQHIAEHGVTPAEAEEIVQAHFEAAVESRSTGRPTVFGWTGTGRYLGVVFEVVDEKMPQVYVITAFEAPPPSPPKRRKKKR